MHEGLGKKENPDAFVSSRVVGISSSWWGGWLRTEEGFSLKVIPTPTQLITI
jgi:hypothetical protein